MPLIRPIPAVVWNVRKKADRYVINLSIHVGVAQTGGLYNETLVF